MLGDPPALEIAMCHIKQDYWFNDLIIWLFLLKHLMDPTSSDIPMMIMMVNFSNFWLATANYQPINALVVYYDWLVGIIFCYWIQFMDIQIGFFTVIFTFEQWHHFCFNIRLLLLWDKLSFIMIISKRFDLELNKF